MQRFFIEESYRIANRLNTWIKRREDHGKDL